MTGNGPGLLADTLAPAQAAAESLFGDGPPREWQPPSRWAWRRPSRRVLLAACFGVLMATGAAAVVRWLPSGPSPAAEPDEPPVSAADPADAPPSIEPIDTDVDDEGPEPTTAAQPAPATEPTLSLNRLGQGWVIAASGASRLVAAQTFAQLSASPLRGSVDALAGSRPLDLHWQGRDPAQAWRALLGSEVSYALQCDARRCQAWIIGTGTTGPIASLRAAPDVPVARPIAARPAPVSLPPPQEPPLLQADSPDPHVASHHD
jgi:hypothetical protein